MASYLSKFANFNLPQLHLAPPLVVTPVEFRKKFWRQKTRVSGLSCGVVCVILRLAVLVELRLVTDGHTDGQTHDHGIYRESGARAVKMTECEYDGRRQLSLALIGVRRRQRRQRAIIDGQRILATHTNAYWRQATAHRAPPARSCGCDNEQWGDWPAKWAPSSARRHLSDPPVTNIALKGNKTNLMLQCSLIFPTNSTSMKLITRTNSVAFQTRGQNNLTKATS